jgi:hypothetical protein
MALGIFELLAKEPVRVERRFGAPKKMTLEAWFAAARKVIPEVPNPKQTDWFVHHEEASRDATWIVYDLQNTVGEKARLTINRKVPLIG